MAWSRDRVLSALLVDGVIRAEDEEIPAGVPVKTVAAVSVSLQDLIRETIRITRASVHRLRARLERVQLLILINDWPVAEQLWWQLAPDFKAPLLELNFLWELDGTRFLPASGMLDSLPALAGDLARIHSEIELRLRDQTDVVDLATALEEHLIPWLKKLDRLLDLLHETNCS